MLNTKKGFTLIEMLVVVTILGILLIISLMSWRRQLDKARDAQRKEDLQRISLAFEEWYSDFGCYPDAAVLNNCGGGGLQPYLDKIPCDPVTDDPYQYVVDEDNPTCYENYRILALLANDNDPAIAALGCASGTGCGWGGMPVYNFGVSSKNVPVANPDLPTPSASPLASSLPSASPGVFDYYACNFTGLCTYRGTNPPAGCDYYWVNSCQADCKNPLYQCPE